MTAKSRRASSLSLSMNLSLTSVNGTQEGVKEATVQQMILTGQCRFPFLSPPPFCSEEAGVYSLHTKMRPATGSGSLFIRVSFFILIPLPFHVYSLPRLTYHFYLF